MARKVTVSKFNYKFFEVVTLFDSLWFGDVMARDPVCLSLTILNLVKTESVPVHFTSPIVSVFEGISVEFT